MGNNLPKVTLLFFFLHDYYRVHNVVRWVTTMFNKEGDSVCLQAASNPVNYYLNLGKIEDNAPWFGFCWGVLQACKVSMWIFTSMIIEPAIFLPARNIKYARPLNTVPMLFRCWMKGLCQFTGDFYCIFVTR